MVGVAVSDPELLGAVQSALETVQSNGVGAIALAGWVGELPTLTADVKVTGLVERVDDADTQDGEEDGQDSQDGQNGQDGEEGTEADPDASAE